MWNDLINSSFLWLSLTGGFFLLGDKLQTKWPKNPLFNPLLFSIIMIIALLIVLNIPLEAYKTNTAMLNFFITPATVSLAIMLERNFVYFKKYFPAILVGVFTGVLFHTGLIYVLSLLMDLDSSMVGTLLPKSITTAVAVDISKSLGGIVSLTFSMVMFTGILGGLMGPFILSLFRIDDPVAQGVALGSSAHALGTARAMEMGEVQGTMAAVSIVVTSMILVILAPLTKPITQLLFG